MLGIEPEAAVYISKHSSQCAALLSVFKQSFMSDKVDFLNRALPKASWINFSLCETLTLIIIMIIILNDWKTVKKEEEVLLVLTHCLQKKSSTR